MHIVSYYRHLIGHRANNVENYVDELMSLYVGGTMNILGIALRGEAPGAAPSRRQRGPRSRMTGMRGRLPIWRATPRRAFLVTLLPYMNLVTTVGVSQS
jgi:hypothetical protein